MRTKAIRTVAKACSQRAVGSGPGTLRAAVAAGITGTATAAVTYKVLRSVGAHSARVLRR